MNMMIWLTAAGVGGATMLGAAAGFAFRRVSQRFSNLVLAFASGIMLAASVLGLILPSLEYGGRWGLPIAVSGILAGAVGLSMMHRAVPYIERRLTGGLEQTENIRARRVLTFAAAIAIHNLPEGLAAGVGFGTGNTADALMIAGGIALQNIPEGMVLIAPMLAAGIPPKRTLVTAMATGVVEIVGTLLGYFAIRAASAILPFTLAFAGGTMLYVISDEMIPETHADGDTRGVTFALLLGFCLMLAADVWMGLLHHYLQSVPDFQAAPVQILESAPAQPAPVPVRPAVQFPKQVPLPLETSLPSGFCC